MLKHRIIPCLLLRNGVLVQSKGFKRHQVLGNPTTAVKRLSTWAADELIYLDISSNRTYEMNRDDLNHENHTTIIDIIKDVSSYAFMPLTFGGGIRDVKDINAILKAGADKVAINTIAVKDPKFITRSAKIFGSQCIVVSIDVAKNSKNDYEVKINGGKDWTGLAPVDWSQEVEKLGAGEILLNSIDRDGLRTGYDIELIKSVVEAVSIPIISIGGVGQWEDFEEVLTKSRVSAVSAANIFHYSEQSVLNAKKYLFNKGINVRSPEILNHARSQKKGNEK